MSKRSLSAIALILILAGCSKSATGQTVAVVNGEEISLSEVNAEVERANIPANVDKKTILPQIVQQLVERRLLTQAAISDGIERSPEYLTQERRVKDELLLRLFSKRQMDSIKLPSKTEIDKFIVENPNMFQQRAMLALDQVLFDSPKDKAVLDELKDDHSLAEVADTLTKRGVAFVRGQSRLDLGSVSSSVADQINVLPAGEPFIAPYRGKLVASVVTNRQPISATDEIMRSEAAQAIQRKKLAALLQSRLNDAKGRAKIEYQPEYQPKPAPKAGSGQKAAGAN